MPGIVGAGAALQTLLPLPADAASTAWPGASAPWEILLLVGILATATVAIGALWWHQRRRARRLRTVVDSLPFELWALDRHGRYIFQNAASLRRQGDHLGGTADDVGLAPETRAAWEDDNRRALAGELVTGAISFPRAGERAGHSSVLGPLDAGGAGGGLVGINVDAPGLRSALDEGELFERQHALLNAIFEGSPETIIATDAERRIRIVNDAFRRLFGYSDDEVIGQNTRMLYVDEEEYDQVGRDYREREGAGESGGKLYIVRFRARDGREFYAETATDILHGPNGEQIGYVGFIRDITERMRVEAEYRDIFNNITEGLCRSTPDGRMLRANPALVRLFGYSSEEELLRNVTDIARDCYVDPEDRDRMIEMLARDGSVESLELEMYRPATGERIWVSESAHGVYDDQGELLYLDVTLNDITERKQAEIYLREQEERYRLLVESSSAIFWEGNPDTLEFSFVSREAEKLLGYPVENWLSSPQFWIDHIHPEDREWVPEFCARASKDRREHQFEYRMIDTEGQVVWLRDIVSCVVEDGGRARNVGVMIDITETKAAEQELARSEERYRILYQRTPVMLHTIDHEGRLIAVSGYWLDHMGYREDEVLGRRSVDFLTEESREHALNVGLPTFAREGRVHEIPYRMVKADGEVIDVLLSAVAEYDSEGGMARGLAVMTDVTEQRRAESRLREAAEVFANTADGVFITDAEGRITDVNEAFTQITGYTRDDVLGARPSKWKSEHHEADFYQQMWRSLEEYGHWRGEIWNRRKDGSVYPAWLTISRVHDDEANLKGYVAVFSDISNVKNAEARLDHLAHHDSLTDLPNRLLLNDRLEHAVSRARRQSQLVALIFMDLDRFKHVNDSLGHTLGDTLLQQAAERLTKCVRSDDTVARIGGDEFTLLLEDVDGEHGCTVVSEKVLQKFSTPFDIGGHEVFVTPSLGIAFYPQDGEDADTLLRNADAAMYQAKHDGGNTFSFYTRTLTRRAFERVQLEGSMRRALERNEFFLQYQPQVDMSSGGVIGAEALLRWEHPDTGVVGPHRFIPIAEETGMIVPIGDWVLEEACAAARRWLDGNVEFERVAVNVAGPQIRRGNLVNAVRKALEGSGLPAGRLELEVTEGFIMEQAERSLGVLNELQELGVRLAIDDFGTGYSSLAYLKRLPIDMLKIDQSFVRDVPAESNNVGICRAVIALAGNLDLDVLAEGVETDEQREFLMAAGCEKAQGYLFSRPLIDEDFASQYSPGRRSN